MRQTEHIPSGQGADELAHELHHARVARTVLDGSRIATTLTMERAYDVQERLTALRLAEGRCHVGYKLGYTSAAMREQMGVQSPNYGPLLDDMILRDNAWVKDFLHPRVEPEIGIVLSKDLPGTGLLLPEIADAVAAVHACLEVVDSVWHDYKFTAEQNTADGSSAAGVVLGPELDVAPLDSHRVTVELTGDGTSLATATSAAAGGHPLYSIAWLADALAARGQHLRKGELVITGGLTAAMPLRPGGIVAARFGRDTTVSIRRPADATDAQPSHHGRPETTALDFSAATAGRADG
ncbi:2-keto-4-pentenoate hydratase [Streptomyces sp. NPDC001002]